MKKIYTLAIGLMMATCSFAQTDDTFVFTDAEGNVIADGETITVNNYELGELDEMLFNSGLYIKNNSDDYAIAAMTVEVTKIDNGMVQICYPQTCRPLKEVGKITIDDTYDYKSGEKLSIQSEWEPEEMGECTVKYTIRLMECVKLLPPTYNELAICSTVTVKYVYDEHSQDVTGINEVKAEKKSGPTVNIAGQRTTANFRGIVIENGKKRLQK